MQSNFLEEIKQELCEIKDFEYKTSLTMLTVLELLVDKNVISAKEIKAKAKKLDKMATR